MRKGSTDDRANEDRFYDVDVSQIALGEDRSLGRWRSLADILSRLRHPVATIATMGISAIAWRAQELTAYHAVVVAALVAIALAEIVANAKWEQQRTPQPADPQADQGYLG